MRYIKVFITTALVLVGIIYMITPKQEHLLDMWEEMN